MKVLVTGGRDIALFDIVNQESRRGDLPGRPALNRAAFPLQHVADHAAKVWECAVRARNATAIVFRLA